MPKIYESPDGGITIRARDLGDYENTITIANPSTFDDGVTIPDITLGGFAHDAEDTSMTDTVPMYATLIEEQERTTLIDKYPELKDKWEEYKELEKHYKAWDLLYTE